MASTRDEYAQRSTSGGMPVALRRPPGRSRSRWFASYADLVVDKDVMDISRVRQREMLPRLLGQLAARSGQVLNMKPLEAIVLYTGEHAYRHDGWIRIMPLSQLWA
jgi:uncharacterized protein